MIFFKCPEIVLEISILLSWNFSKNVLKCPGMSWNFDFIIVWPLWKKKQRVNILRSLELIKELFIVRGKIELRRDSSELLNFREFEPRFLQKCLSSSRTFLAFLTPDQSVIFTQDRSDFVVLWNKSCPSVSVLLSVYLCGCPFTLEKY